LLIKTADGGNWWYGGLSGYHNIRNAIHAEGIGCIPYTYSYGNKYNALDAEIDILIALLQSDGVACADMEAEWNGQTAWASHLASRIQGKGMFLVSTWADPSAQNWIGVLQALNPCVSCYLPQQYNNYLATFWGEFGNAGAACLQPTVNLLQDFGPNDPVAIAKAAHSQGHTSLSVWYHETAVANPTLLDQIFAAFPKTLSGGNTMSTVPQGWTDDGTTLKAPDGTPITLGFRDYVLNNNWDPANIPLEPEQHCDPLEQSNPSLGAGQQQLFRWTTLEYTQARGVFEAWSGQELLWYQKQATQLQSQITDLQKQLSENTLTQEIAALKAKIIQAVKDLS
jgi:hypothetical protein